jgi:RNA polymerase sigma-B factor
MSSRESGDAIVPLTDAEQRIVEENKALVYHVANKYRRAHPIPEHVYQDLVSRLFYRLCVCAQNYKPERGYAISSYVVKSLRGEIKNYFRDESWVIRPPRRIREMSFSDAVDATDTTVSRAEQEGENPATIISCAVPVPLDSTTVEREDDEYELDVASEENVEERVVNSVGGRQMLKEMFDSLKYEERIIFALLLKQKSPRELEERFGISRSDANAAWRELGDKAKTMYFAIFNGDPAPQSSGSEALTRALRKQFIPECVNFLAVRERVMSSTIDGELCV